MDSVFKSSEYFSFIFFERMSYTIFESIEIWDQGRPISIDDNLSETLLWGEIELNLKKHVSKLTSRRLHFILTLQVKT